MPIACACPKCGQKMAAPDDSAGKTAKCPKCETLFRVPFGASQQQAVQAVPVNTDHVSPPRKFTVRLGSVLFIIRALMWSVCIMVVMSTSQRYGSEVMRQPTVMHQCALAADALLTLVAYYVGCRAMDAILRGIPRAGVRD